MLKVRYDQVSKKTLFSQKFNISIKSVHTMREYFRLLKTKILRKCTKMSKEKCIHIWYALKNLGASEDLYTRVRM